MFILTQEPGNYIQQNIRDQGDEYMNFHSHLASAEAPFHRKSPLQSFEDFFYGPACLIKLGNRHRRHVESIGEERIDFTFFCLIDNQAQFSMHFRKPGTEGNDEFPQNPLLPMVSLESSTLKDGVGCIDFKPGNNKT